MDISTNTTNATYQDIPTRIEQFPGALSVAQLASILGLSRTTVWSMASAGTIPCLRLGRNIRFDPARVAEWVRASQS
jgi:excisionase family DNA binding protein